MTACPACRKSFSPSFIEERGEYKLCECPACGLGFFLPLKFPGREYYEKEDNAFYTDFHAKSIPLSPWHELFFRYPLEKRGQLLDIGCGNGAFLAAAQEAGYDVHGIDFDRKSVQFAREQRGLKTVEAISLEDYAKQNRRFDVITLFEVLEHQVDPLGFLTLVQSLLKPGGVLTGTMPNRHRIRLGPEEEGDFPPNHFLRWTPKSLSGALRGAGLTPMRVQTENIHNVIQFFTSGLAGKVKQSQAPIKQMAGSGASSRRVSILKVLKSLRWAAFWPLGQAMKLLGKGESLFFQARK